MTPYIRSLITFYIILWTRLTPHIRSLIKFYIILWIGLGIGAYFQVPTHIQNLLAVKGDRPLVK